MPPPPRFWPRRTAVLAFAATAALLLLPTTALAVDEATATSTSCDDLLVTFDRAAVTGDDHAVALTAQSIDEDTDGWLLLSWQAAEDTHLTAVLATGTDGTTRTLDPTPTGTVNEVATLTFCGTTATGSGFPANEVVADEPLEPTDEVTIASQVPDAAPTAPANGPANPAASASKNTPANPAASRPENAPADADAATGDERDDHDEDGDVEVLGVRLVAPIEPREPAPAEETPAASAHAGDRRLPVALAGSDQPWSGLPPLLLATAIAAGIVGGGSVQRGRSTRQATTTTDTAEAGR